MTSKLTRIKQPERLVDVGFNRAWYFILTLSLLVGIILRLTLRHSSTLWEDEIIAATHAVQPFWRVIINCIINDMHPPLYFLELHTWAFFSQADWWLIANSCLCSVLALASLFFVLQKIYDRQLAYTSTAVFALLPVPIWMAEEVRMYALLSILLIWMFYFVHQCFCSKVNKPSSYIIMAILGFSIVYMHAIGFIAVLFFGIYSGTWLITRRADRREWLAWISIFGGIGALALPMLFSDTMRQADMPPIKGFSDILNWTSSVIIGGGYQLVDWLKIAGIAIYAATVCACIYFSQTRRITLCFLVAPLILCLIIGVIARPLFKTDFFSNFYSPFLAIVIGTILVNIPLNRLLRTILLVITLTCLAGIAISNRLAIDKTEGYYSEIIRTIKTNIQTGDVIWVPQGDIFWGVLWYMDGPNWGSPVSTIAPLRPGSGWYKLFNILGPKLVDELDLMPKTQSIITSDGLKIITASATEGTFEGVNRLWLVTYAPRNDVPSGLSVDGIGSLKHVQSFSFSPLQLNLYERHS